MKMPMFALAAALLLPSMAQAVPVTLDYNEGSYLSSLTGTFDIGADYGPISSASLNLLIAGRRTSYNSRGDGWYYDNDTTLSAAVDGAWAHMSLPGDFQLHTFPLTADALTTLENSGTFTFTITGNSAYWYSDLSPWGGTTTSRFYIDYATLDIALAPVPEPASLAMAAVGLVVLAARPRRAAD